jgi:hypothetical protein
MSRPLDAGDAGHADDEMLASYALDPGGVDDAAARHVAGCAACSAEVAWYRALLRVGAMRRDRAGCPTAETVQAYALGELTDPARRATEAHVASCLQCAAEVLATRESLALPAGAAQEQEGAMGAVARARRIVATLLPLRPAADPAFALRGPEEGASEDVRPRTFAADGVELTLRHEPERGAFVLYGTIAGDGPTPASTPLSARLLNAPEAGDVAVAGAGPTLSAEVPIEFRAFEFHGVTPGTYQLEVLFPDRVIVISSLTL